MRICFVIERLAGVRGGAERVLLEIGAAMEDRGHSVSVVSFDSGRTEVAYPTQLDIFDLSPPTQRSFDRVVAVARGGRALMKRSRTGPKDPLEWWPAPGLIERPLSASSGTPTLVNKIMWRIRNIPRIAMFRHWLNSHPQDVVIAFMPTAIALAGSAIGELDGEHPKFIASTHSLPNVDFGDQGRFDPNPIVRRAAFDGLRRADAITVLQPSFVDMLPPELAIKAQVLPNSVCVTEFDDDQREDLVVGVGRLTAIKRFDMLLEAFRQLADEFPSWNLEICGDGPQAERLRSMSSELGLASRVRFNGSVENIDQVYARAKVLVHPALFEGFGLVIAEAVSHGLGVVCSEKLHSSSLLVEDGITGALAEDSVEGFASAMRRAFTLPTPRVEFRAAADRLCRKFEPDIVLDRWESLIIGQPSESCALT